MARSKSWQRDYVKLLDKDVEYEWSEDQPLSSIPPGICGSQQWAYDKQKYMPEQQMTNLAEIQVRGGNKVENDEMEGDGEVEERAKHGFQDHYSVIGQNISPHQL